MVLRSGTYFISTDFIQKLVSEVGDGSDAAEGEQSQGNNLYPLLMQHNGGRDSWNKGKNITNIIQIFVDRSHMVNIMIFTFFFFFNVFKGVKDSAQQDKFGNTVSSRTPVSSS